jgi:DNA-binding transcriptional ArsR family regulator
MTGTIMEVIREMVRTSGKPAKELARELGKPYSTFMRELSQRDTGAKLGVDLLLPLMRACDSIAPLRYLAARLGCRVAALPEGRPEPASLEAGLLDAHEALGDYHRAMRDGQPPEAVAELRERLIRQGQEAFVAYTTGLEPGPQD